MDMFSIKTYDEIKKMQEGGRILACVMSMVCSRVAPGITGIQLDALAEKEIIRLGAKPSFKTVKNYKYATCICINDVVVHGIPTQVKLREKDVVGIDCGVLYKGYHTDMGNTLQVGSSRQKMQDEKIEKFLNAGKRALEKAINTARLGNRIGHISKAMQETIQTAGYCVVKTLVGHGIGRKLHEEPEVPCFQPADINKTDLLKKNMTIAIEVIYNMGKEEVIYSGNDSWTIATADGSLSAFFEKTVLVTEKDPIILTSY